MKKMLIIGMMIAGAAAYGRDFEHRERNEIQSLLEKPAVSRERLARERAEGERNMEKYAEFHWELMNMDRGREDR